jgi:hypothetical protein
VKALFFFPLGVNTFATMYHMHHDEFKTGTIASAFTVEKIFLNK